MTANRTHAAELPLLREATEWRLLSLLLQCPAGGWHDRVAELAREAADPLLGQAVAAARAEATEPLYHTTLGPGGPAAPREVSYRRVVQPGQTLGEVTAAYEAFQYAPDIPEPPDHVAVESGFVAYLRFKEAYAEAAGWPEQAAVCRQAAKLFVAEHLAYIAEPLARTLAHSGVEYLTLASRSLSFRTGPSPALPVLQPVEEAEVDEEEQSCC